MKCPHHTGVIATVVGQHPPCELQQLANHTITVTEARRPGVRCIVILYDENEPDHVAAGFSVYPLLAHALLEEQAAKLRAAIGDGERP